MRPTFIATGARFGSTLLRWLIDAHPEITCPSETDVAILLGDFRRCAEALSGPDSTGDAWGRLAVENLMDAHLHQTGKSTWADKSMSNAMSLDLLADTWVGARFVMLHRHVMDFIASALEAQPWGLTDYGFMPFAAQCPGDNVAALARYWVDRTTRMLTFERACAHPNLRVRYEDLVMEPEATLGALWTLMGVDAPADGPEAAFEAHHDAFGSADHLIWYTRAISQDSVGKGARIPPARIAGQFRGQVNGLLAELGFPPIDDDWGAGGLVSGNAVVRVVENHRTISYTKVSLERDSVIAVESSAVPGIVKGSTNIGSALRNRDVRYYGKPLAGYGEERELFEALPKALAEMGF